MDQFLRTSLQLGEENFKKIKNSHISVFGLGGVGGFAVESLVRSGIGKIDIFDPDTISLTNLNRQIIATHSNIGKLKVDAFKERLLDINNQLEINTFPCFVNKDNISQIDFSKYDYVADCIDTVSTKLLLIQKCTDLGVKLISCMGTGNKLDPTLLKVQDIFKTTNDPLARVLRSKLKKLGINKLKVVSSSEVCLNINSKPKDENSRPIISSNAFVPACAGLILASEIVRDLCGL